MYMTSKKQLSGQAFQKYSALYPADKVQGVELDVFANIIKNEENIKRLMPNNVFVASRNWVPLRVNSHSLFNAARKCNTTITFAESPKYEINSLSFGNASKVATCVCYNFNFFGTSADDLIKHVLVHLQYYESVLVDQSKIALIMLFPVNINRNVIKNKLYPLFGEEYRSKHYSHTQGVCVEAPLKTLITPKL